MRPGFRRDREGHALTRPSENTMSFINKPKVAHPSLPTNALGLTRRQYEGSHVHSVRGLRT